MTYIPFCSLEVFSSVYTFLKFNFWSICKLKCFREALRSTGTSLRETEGWKGFTIFREKITSWVCLVMWGLNIIFHWCAHPEVLFRCKLKCLRETLRSAGSLLREIEGWKGFTIFQEKRTSWACLVVSGLNIIFHWSAHPEVLFKSLISSVETLM